MRESSFNFSTQNSQQLKDIRGGEKKVMKKSLSAILSLAMAFSMFSSVALGADAKKTSADFTDLKDLDAATKAKFDEMISAGVFDGVKEGTFGLKDKMNRAQFAKVAALIFNLKVDTSLKTSSFSDVKSDDPANGYALPYIEAVKAAGITDGYAPGQFNPAGDVTKEQLATFLIRGLNKDSEGKNKTGVSDKTVSDWAKGYVALALELKLLGNSTDGAFGGTSAATRDLLVTSSYEAKKQYVDTNKPAKASVKEVKAVDYNKVQVTLDREVDADKATFVLKKGTAETKYEAKDKDVKWSEDKKVATVTLKDGQKIVDATYTVTLGGLDASTVDKVSGEFKGENEKLKDIDFVTANDTVAKSKQVRIQVKPMNQYGQLASLAAGNFSVNVPLPDSNATVKKSSDGTKMYVELNTDNPNMNWNASFSVNIWSNDQREISKTKVFKVGEYPYIAKVELGEVKYNNDKDAITASGNEAVVKMTQYDQYGGEITVNSGGERNKITDSKPNLMPKNSGVFDEALDTKIEDKDGDGIKEVIVFVKSDKKIKSSGEFTLQVWGGGTGSTATIKVSATKIATKVELGDFNKNNIAVNDKDIYLELIAYDAAGTKLTPDEIVDNVKDNRFNISVNGPLEFNPTDNVPKSMLDNKGQVVTAGEHKGKLHFAKVASKNSGSVWVYINNMSGPDNNKSKSYSIVDARYPVSIKTITEGANKAVAGAEVKTKYQLIDNYQEVIKENLDGFRDNNNKGVTYDVYATVANSGVQFELTDINVNKKKNDGIKTTGNKSEIGKIQMKDFSDKEIELKTRGGNSYGSTEVKFVIRKFVEGNSEPVDSSVASVTKRISIVDPTKEDLRYSLAPIDSLFKTLDDSAYKDIEAKRLADGTSKLAREIKIEARDTSGSLVAYPANISEVTADNISFVSTTEGKSISGKGYVLGNKPGTANITAYFMNAKGESVSASGTVTVKGDAVKMVALERDDSNKTLYNKVNQTVNAWDLMGNITLKDNYANEFKNEFIFTYDKITKVRYLIKDATLVNNKPIAEVDASQPDRIKINGTGTFTITATTSNGLSVITTVNVN
ncbi:S-layer homology domain-containing protein [Paenibacillus sp. MZ04-78.2]|uniref:S-layer homology domain-containing protein n=1 Tax=Paenibacillus sp. MZ04-78.2 TaxID=2962034 RepID=UPI0020B672E6|nr:S-layer homology domain-containing protein [Paenibacillus sp. MZ04-78.2]MCP3776269.1 S-layer homology domain-containing protein [Paenibacillus sp. MZ04-78.2]